MKRGSEWQSYAVPLVWTEFTADIVEHRVREASKGERFAVTLLTPGHLEKLSEDDRMNLELYGFPVHLYTERDQGREYEHPQPTVETADVLQLSEEAAKTSGSGNCPTAISGVSDTTHCSAQKLDNPEKILLTHCHSLLIRFVNPVKWPQSKHVSRWKNMSL